MRAMASRMLSTTLALSLCCAGAQAAPLSPGKPAGVKAAQYDGDPTLLIVLGAIVVVAIVVAASSSGGNNNGNNNGGGTVVPPTTT
jgi:hypothetical protein